MDDFKKAIDYLGGLRRLNILINENSEADALKKKMEVWRHKMNLDLQKQEHENKMQRIKR